ncbi:MAG: AmmeMemoRadiSam system protein B [Planctomycetota bacterium]|jgi:AmmeMemoRadiSam system protein B
MDEKQNFPLPEKPAIRPELQAYPVELEDGNQAFVLNDPLEIAPGSVIVPAAAVAIIQFMTGENTLRDIQATIMHHTDGTLVPMESIEGLVQQLDDNYLIISDRLESFYADYKASPVRDARHAGNAYPIDKTELRTFLDSCFTHEDGPGDDHIHGNGKELVAFIAPHIDLKAGGSSFAWAYRAVQDNEPADLYIILGVAHMSAQTHLGEYIPLLLTDKDFRTPLGTAKTDRNFVEALAKRLPFDAFQGELIHRQEHSVEFQAIWLSHILGNNGNFSIVPALVGSFHEQVEEKKKPEDDKNIIGMIEALRETIREYPGRVCVISSADLAHVGPKFDDPPALDGVTPNRVEEADREMLANLEKLDYRAFYNYIAEEENRRHVCGYGSIYTTLAITSPDEGRLLAYDQAHEEPAQSLVSFASMAFFAGGDGEAK